MKTISTTFVISITLGIGSFMVSSPFQGENHEEVDRKGKWKTKKPGMMGGKRGGPPKMQSGNVKGLFLSLDEDGSEGLTLDEFSKAPRLMNLGLEKRQALFSKLDKNKDGLISSEEVHQGRMHDRGREAFSEADVDASGGLTLDEFRTMPFLVGMPKEHLQRVFQRIDQNANATLEQEELEAARGRHDRGRVMHLWGRLKSEGVLDDGAITKEELISLEIPPEIAERMFNHLDRDGDGVIRGEEIPKFGKRGAKRSGRKPDSSERRSGEKARGEVSF